MRIGFGILLDEQSHNFARQVQLELCHKFGLCWGLKQIPHITIKSPFETDKLEPFADYLESLNIAPFEIELEGFNHFDQKVIFLDVKENKALKELHFQILSDMEKFGVSLGKFEGDNVKFHSTLAFHDITEDRFLEASKYLEKYNPKFKFMAKKLAIFYDLGAAGYTIIRKVRLNSPVQPNK